MKRLSLAICAGLLLAALIACSSISGCQSLRKMTGIKTTVSDPEPGSPQAVLQDALKAALQADEGEGWEAFRALLHSDQLLSPASEASWRTMNFATFRRKAKLYLEDDAVPTYQLAFVEEPRENIRKLFIHNEMSDAPTPCSFKRDAKAENAWRINLCSL